MVVGSLFGYGGAGGGRVPSRGSIPGAYGSGPGGLVRNQSSAAGLSDQLSLSNGGLAYGSTKSAAAPAVTDKGDVLPYYESHRGSPMPLGVNVERRLLRDQESIYINFAISSTTAKNMTLVLWVPEAGVEAPPHTFTLDPNLNKTGAVWHIGMSFPLSAVGVPSFPDVRKWHYGYRVNNAPGVIADPYAKCLASGSVWGERADKDYFKKDRSSVRRCVVWPDGDGPAFDWDGDLPPRVPEEDLIIYEMHVRGFTYHQSSKVGEHRGTYMGVVDKIPHLRELGINCVELLPVYEWNELEYEATNPVTKKRLCNYWGYSTENFFAPMGRFATRSGNTVHEFKTMVRELHRAGIEVILDVVFNHTAEQGKNGRVLSFRALDELVWYIHGPPPKNDLHNYSGCGNTVNANHPIALQFIIDCLRYWVTEMHVDGFRFDLASILCRDENGTPLARPPVVEAIALDPVLAGCKLMAEPWDAGGLYQVGAFPHWGHWAEWNGKYRDAVRKFMKGGDDLVGQFATRICGSQDLYGIGRRPYHSINFVTCHDGFSLYDLVAYNAKHNFENGENNQDGCNDNDSWNCGAEGETNREDVNSLRQRQMRNMHLCLMLSHGTPMMLSGDEYGHTKGGNNNTWPTCPRPLRLAASPAQVSGQRAQLVPLGQARKQPRPLPFLLHDEQVQAAAQDPAAAAVLLGAGYRVARVQPRAAELGHGLAFRGVRGEGPRARQRHFRLLQLLHDPDGAEAAAAAAGQGVGAAGEHVEGVAGRLRERDEGLRPLLPQLQPSPLLRHRPQGPLSRRCRPRMSRPRPPMNL